MTRILALGAVAALVMGTFSGALAQDVERHECLRHNQIDDMIQLDEDKLVLLVDGGTTVYMLDLTAGCFAGSPQSNLALTSEYDDGCVRTTDIVTYGRRSCQIRDFTLIETQEQLDEVLASLDE